MALHTTLEEHNADPPSGWIVRKSGRYNWHLESAKGGVIGTFATKRKAMEARESGFYVDLYNKEGRWFAGENVIGWRKYVPATVATLVVLLTLTGCAASSTITIQRHTEEGTIAATVTLR